MSEPAIAIRNLTKVFPIPFKRERVVAVKDLSLDVQPGQVYGLLGPNGSGKSTTMKIVLGLIPPTSGGTQIFGRDSQLVESREEVGFLPENPYFYKYLTGMETLLFYGKICGLRGAALKDRAHELLQLVGLENARDRRLGGYSKGMLQRIGLAQALVQNPRLLVLDEPTASLDPARRRALGESLAQLAASGRALLVTSHDDDFVRDFATEVLILADGDVVERGAPGDVLNAPQHDATKALLRGLAR